MGIQDPEYLTGLAAGHGSLTGLSMPLPDVICPALPQPHAAFAPGVFCVSTLMATP